ncbi:hypothetical protein LDENG_00025230 [Lucifuga dentata]|nr:hypothetical protein LDENG_00025230 [Lucifuga dentata]
MNDSDNELDHLSLVFKELRAEGQLCDAVIATGDVKFPVHKLILSGCSEYFRNLFTLWSQPEEIEHEFHHVSPDLMRLLIEFAYVGSVPLSEQNVCELFRAADYFCFEGLMEACCQFLQQQLCPHNCIGIWLFIRKYYCPKLIHEAYLFILHNFGEASASSDFLQLSLQDLISIIEEDRLQVKQESIVFEAVLRWIDHSSEERGAYISQLLSKASEGWTVRLALMTQDYFNSVKTNQLVMESNECQPTVRKAESLLNGIRDGANDYGFYHFLARPRLPSMILLAIGGTEGLEDLSCYIEAYDARADCWTGITSGEEPARVYHGVVFLGVSVYCIGGWNDFESLSSVFRFDLVTRTWHEVAPMHRSRGSVSVTLLNGLVYALGGSDGHTVYICGGADEDEILLSAEFYLPETDQWTLIAPMSIRRTDLGVIAYAGQIYAVGGFTGVIWLDTAEAYNPETDSWSAVPSMLSPRSKFGIGVVDDRVYVVGGSSGVATISDVEFYDVKTGQWSEARNLDKRRRALNCCVVSGLNNMAQYSAPRDPFTIFQADLGNSSRVEEYDYEID